MDPNNTPAVKNNTLWVWITLIGGFVIIVLLIAILLYNPVTNKSSTTKTDKSIEEEIDSVDIDNLDSDFQQVEKDIDKL